MSYIVAFVNFRTSKDLYPVSCWRSDIKEGDAVLVRMKSRGDALKHAEVAYLTYYNWNCTNWIECLASEAKLTREGVVLPDPPLRHSGVNRPVDVWNVIKQFGWRLHRTRSRTYEFACSARNATSVCYLFFRKNGVDMQFTDLAAAAATDDDVLSFASTARDAKREDCRNTDTNFYVYICELARAFSEDRDFNQVRRPSRSTRRIPWSGPTKGEQDTNWRDAFKDTSGYLHDDQWLGRSW